MADWEVRASTELPIVARDEWDGDEALDNILGFFRDEDGNVDARLAPRGFLLFNADEDGNDKNDYKFPFADIVNGELAAITRGIEVADSFLQDASVDERTQEEMAEVINEYRRRSDDLNDPEDAGEEDGSSIYVIPKNIAAPGGDGAPATRKREEVKRLADETGESTVERMTDDLGKTEDELPYETSNTTYRGVRVKDVDVKNGIVTGYFANFNTVDADGERFQQGAFEESIIQDGPQSDSQRIKHLYQHDIWGILGVPQVLKEDATGLYFETEIMKTSLGRDVLEMYRHDALEHSVGFIRQEEEESEEGITVITRARLMEGSSVTWGANPDTPFTGFKSGAEVVDYLSEKARSLRSLLKEDLRDVRLEQIELGLRQLEAELQKLDELMIDDEPPSKEEVENEVDWPPPSTSFFEMDDEEKETLSSDTGSFL